ncbi:MULTISPECIES: acetate--CoA ligase family protein [Actinomycetes]|uniref:acetate--CoA ligase family protein n=1 Tax=Actinomycetes TaxID=1760 RepID=UPI000526795D|nr:MULTISPECIES: acetate--CoA ligase family protein [Actinomycetes]
MTVTEIPSAAKVANLNRLLRPRSVAVIGASDSPGKLGSVMVDALISGGKESLAVYPINPRIDSNDFYSSLAEATAEHGSPLDLAVFCIPAATTAASLREAAQAGVGGAVICSGGFAEAGPDGVRAQQEIAEICAATGIRVLGPNTSGFFRPGDGIRVSFVPTVAQITAGTVAVVAASGGMNHALSFLLSERGVGVGVGIGLGNCVDVTNADVLEHLRTDESITAIGLHVESVTDGTALVEAIRAVTERTPVVAIAVGRADVSAFSESHTGALATSWKTTRALLAQAGAVVVDTELELVDALATLSRTRLPAAERPGIGIVTAQAGPGLMILDDMLSHGIAVPPLSQRVTDELSKLLPPMTFQSNPVDTGRPGASFGAVLTATAADKNIDALAVYALAEPDAVDLADAVRTSGVNDIPIVLGIGGPAGAIEMTTQSAAALGVPVLPSPTSLATGVRALVHDARARYLAQGRPVPMAVSEDTAQVAFPMDEHDAKNVLDRLGIRTPQRRACENRAAAHAAFDELSGPLAVKILDATVVHKTEVGGVHLGVRSRGELNDALDRIGAMAYLLEEMAGSGVDLILGVRRDAVFGPVLVAGLGGTAAEAIGDVAIRGHDLSETEAATMLDDLLCAPLLAGWRGGPVLNRTEFASVAVSLAQYVRQNPAVGDIEINPLRVTATGLVALDAVVLPAVDDTTGGPRR